ncbi:TMV resistance protein N-like [Pyrus communis]|uniref:TMV resistance protein N-like n=1 Tax=Pyrus communis TaxID=23211 RepID=UPI0035C083C7
MAAASSSSSCDNHWKYNVFLNFRGLEAAAASSSAISTKLWIRKQSTPSSTLKSFEKAMIFQSSWQLVVPVFYKVDPSDIRKLKGSFAEAFAEHDVILMGQVPKPAPTYQTEFGGLAWMDGATG